MQDAWRQGVHVWVYAVVSRKAMPKQRSNKFRQKLVLTKIPVGGKFDLALVPEQNTMKISTGERFADSAPFLLQEHLQIFDFTLVRLRAICLHLL